MILAEFIKPNARWIMDLRAIKELGTAGDAEAGLAQRGHAIRSLIKKWEGHVSPNIIRKIRDVLALAEVYGGSMPVLPNPKAHLIETAAGFKEFWDLTQQAWKDMISYKDREAKGQLSNQVEPAINRFVKMTERLEAFIPAEINRQVVPRNANTYEFIQSQDHPGRLVSEIHDDQDIVFFRELEKATAKSPDNLTRWRTFETREDMLAAGKFKYKINDTEIKAATGKVLKPLAKNVAINENDLKDDEAIVDGAIVAGEIYEGVKIPLPTDKLNRYYKTVLERSKSEVLAAILKKKSAEKGVELSEKTLLLKRPELIKHILKIQKKRDVTDGDNAKTDTGPVPDGNTGS